MVDVTLIALATLGAALLLREASAVDWVLPSRKPLNMAPRHIAVRLRYDISSGVTRAISKGTLRFDTCGLHHIYSLLLVQT